MPPPLGATPCDLSAWSSDGFGHQLAGALSCKILALAKPSAYRYVPSRRTEIEHAPADAAGLLDFVSALFLEPAGRPPLAVRPRSYHAVCDGREPRACGAGGLTVCDNCFRTVDPIKHAAAVRAVVGELRTSVAAAAGGASCARRAAVCVHMRGLGTPGLFNDSRHTSRWAERDSMHKRTYPARWWRRAIGAALNESRSGRVLSVGAVEEAAAVVVHTNSLELANRSLGPLGGGGEAGWAAGVRLRVRGPETPLLAVLHELAFCCRALVVGRSALASVATLMTHAKATFSPEQYDLHFRLRNRVVPLVSAGPG